jgi:hypothetical protein
MAETEREEFPQGLKPIGCRVVMSELKLRPLGRIYNPEMYL